MASRPLIAKAWGWAICTLCGLAAGLPARSDAAVETLLEARQRHVVVQQWDLSCGAAALATILAFQHGDRVSEREVAIGLMNRDIYLAQPRIVRWRHGFSLLDLKRYVDARGYRGVGLGNLDFDGLRDLAPIIVPIRTHGYQHFVVYRGAHGNRVLLADPAFGNRTMLRSAFEAEWMTIGDHGRVGFIVRRTDALSPPNRLAPSAGDFPTLR